MSLGRSEFGAAHQEEEGLVLSLGRRDSGAARQEEGLFLSIGRRDLGVSRLRGGMAVRFEGEVADLEVGSAVIAGLREASFRGAQACRTPAVSSCSEGEMGPCKYLQGRGR